MGQHLSPRRRLSQSPTARSAPLCPIHPTENSTPSPLLSTVQRDLHTVHTHYPEELVLEEQHMSLELLSFGTEKGEKNINIKKLSLSLCTVLPSPAWLGGEVTLAVLQSAPIRRKRLCASLSLSLSLFPSLHVSMSPCLHATSSDVYAAPLATMVTTTGLSAVR